MKRRIGIDLCGTDGGKSGLGTYAREMVHAFLRYFPEREYRLIGCAEDREAYFDATLQKDPRVLFHEVSAKYASAARNILWHRFGLPRLARKLELEALFVVAGNRRGTVLRDIPLIVSVADLWNLHVPGKFGRMRQYYLDNVLPKWIRGASAIVAISEFTKKDVVRYCNINADSVAVTYLAVDHDRFHPGEVDDAVAAVRAEVPSARPPFLSYGVRIEHPAKNHLNLIRAFEILKDKHHIPHSLLCPGKAWPGAEPVLAAARESRHAAHIHFPGFVSSGFIPAMYRASDLSVFPSHFEGFGLPVLESMACGTPVAASSLDVLQEIGSDAALFFDPNDPEAIAVSIMRIVGNVVARADYRRRSIAHAARFTWERTARETMAVIDRATPTRKKG